MQISRKALYYIMFCVLHIIFLILEVSLISFFHFRLGHTIEIIEEWVFDNGWILIISGKVISFFILIKLFYPKGRKNKLISEKVLNYLDSASRETFLVLFLFLSLNLFFGIKENKSYVLDAYKLTLSFFFSFLFYIIDIFYLEMMSKEMEPRRLWIENAILSGIFVVFSKISFLLVTIQNSSLKSNLIVSFINMMILLFLRDLSSKDKKNFINPILFLALFICPMMSFFGWDPIWGKTYSFFENGILFESKIYLVIGLFILYYLNLKRIRYRKEG